MAVLAEKFIVNKHFHGEPRPGDLTLAKEKLPPLREGEIFVKAEYLSVDPYMRPYSTRLPSGATMMGFQVAKIIESKHPDFPEGKRILAHIGWRSHSVFNPDKFENTYGMDPMPLIKPYVLPDYDNLPPSLALGMLGMPGNSAYFGFLEICKPQPGETVVVSAAAGAVGSHVGQIAKICGCKVVGITGSDNKCKWLVEELGFDAAINYRTEKMGPALSKAAPNGIDCYFDNVGGEITASVIYQMNFFGRVSVCGSISSYNYDPLNLPKSTLLQPVIVFKQLKIEGFLINRFVNRWFEGIEQNLKWIHEGKLKYKETVSEGFESMFRTFAGMMKGENVGKAIVKAY